MGTKLQFGCFVLCAAACITAPTATAPAQAQTSANLAVAWRTVPVCDVPYTRYDRVDFTGEGFTTGKVSERPLRTNRHGLAISELKHSGKLEGYVAAAFCGTIEPTLSKNGARQDGARLKWAGDPDFPLRVNSSIVYSRGEDKLYRAVNLGEHPDYRYDGLPGRVMRIRLEFADGGSWFNEFAWSEQFKARLSGVCGEVTFYLEGGPLVKGRCRYVGPPVTGSFRAVARKPQPVVPEQSPPPRNTGSFVAVPSAPTAQARSTVARELLAGNCQRAMELALQSRDRALVDEVRVACR